MAIAITPYTERWIPAVRAFNQRLALGGVPEEFRFPESAIPTWLPKLEGRRLYQEFYLATDGDSVRGGYIVKFQDFAIGGAARPLAYYHLPISEGLTDKAYATVGVHMLRSAMRLRPELYCLGMGGFDKPLPLMLKAMGWNLRAVPFYFRVVRPARFLRRLPALRGTPFRRLLTNVAAHSGTGWVALQLLQRLRTRRSPGTITPEVVTGFGPATDEVWRRCQAAASLIGSRDSTSLNILYPPESGFHCLLFRRGDEAIGWAVLKDTRTQGSRHFGNLRVGSIVDCLGAPEHATAMVRAAARFLVGRGVDLIVTNQAHRDWGAACAASGFLTGPSNFIFAASKPLSEAIAAADPRQEQLHLTRGDGDGPVNL